MLLGALPRKWTGPSVGQGKEVAIEELVLVAEQLEFESTEPHRSTRVTEYVASSASGVPNRALGR